MLVLLYHIKAIMRCHPWLIGCWYDEGDGSWNKSATLKVDFRVSLLDLQTLQYSDLSVYMGLGFINDLRER